MVLGRDLRARRDRGARAARRPPALGVRAADVRAAAGRPPGEGWIGCGSGFAVYGSLGLQKVLPEVHPTAIAIAQLAAPRLEAGEGVDAALAVPSYVRDKVAFTKEELARR